MQGKMNTKFQSRTWKKDSRRGRKRSSDIMGVSNGRTESSNVGINLLLEKTTDSSEELHAGA